MKSFLGGATDQAFIPKTLYKFRICGFVMRPLWYREVWKMRTFGEMTAQEIFEQIKARAQRATDMQGSFKFIVDGDKFIYIDAQQSPPAVSMEDKPADCTVRLSSDTLSDLLSGKANPATAFMFGKIKVEGNMGLAMALTKIL